MDGLNNICINFYPRSPRGERPEDAQRMAAPASFLSTLPARGATSLMPASLRISKIFLSTLPARGATQSRHMFF